VITKFTFLHSMSILLMNLTFFAHPQNIALVGGTVIDVSNFGTSDSDINNAIIIIKGEKITEVGRRGSIKIPEGAQVFEITGKYVLPGLIDGFASLDNQSYANAYLYMGVTSIVGIGGFRRAPLYENADPCPNIYHEDFVGKWKITTEEMLKQIDELARKEVKFLLLMYELRPGQLKPAIEKAHVLGMATIGELGHTSYKDAIGFGIDALIHSSRYAIEMAPPEMRAEVAAQPFGLPSKKFKKWLAELNPEHRIIKEYAEILGSNQVALIPTLSLYCIDLPDIENPWKEPVAIILNPEDINFPVDRSTGKHNFESEIQKELILKAMSTLERERQFYKAGARYLAGSGTDVFGTMPGISLHQELELLTKIGLSEREAIATATSNFAEVFNWKEIGQIKPGCRADIIITDKNPLENIKNLKTISVVILKGNKIDRDNLLRLR